MEGIVVGARPGNFILVDGRRVELVRVCFELPSNQLTSSRQLPSRYQFTQSSQLTKYQLKAASFSLPAK